MALGLTSNAAPAQSLSFEAEGDTIYVNGYTTRRSLRHFLRVADRNPEAKRLVLEEVPGSDDDETNVQLGREIHARGFNTVALSGSFIASGGVDLFLAGREREIACGAELGVHSWQDGQGREGGQIPASAQAHWMFLDYYQAIGIAEAFYWFTLEAAPAAGIHVMTDAELERYTMATLPRDC